MNYAERELLKTMVLDLEAQGRRDIYDVPPLVGDKLWDSLSGRSMAETQLEQSLARGAVDFGAQWIALPVDRSKTWRPVLWMKIDLTQATPTNLQIVLVNVKALDAALAFRFETPSEAGPKGEPGLHHFHHMQLTRTLRPFGDVHGVPPWIPESFPTFPLDADTPLGLMLSMLLALYGFGFEERLIANASIRQQLADRCRELGCVGKLPDKSLRRRTRKGAKKK